MNEAIVPGITRKPGVRGGRPCITGTGIRVTDIVMSVRYEERNPSQIAEDLAVSPEQVQAALEYYQKNAQEIDKDIDRQINTFERLTKAAYDRPVDSILPR